jgi:hypothetical protein
MQETENIIDPKKQKKIESMQRARNIRDEKRKIYKEQREYERLLELHKKKGLPNPPPVPPPVPISTPTPDNLSQPETTERIEKKTNGRQKTKKYYSDSDTDSESSEEIIFIKEKKISNNTKRNTDNEDILLLKKEIEQLKNIKSNANIHNDQPTKTTINTTDQLEQKNKDDTSDYIKNLIKWKILQ